MKDPLDNRPDAYALLWCAESCTRADAQRSYTAQLVRRTAPQRELQAARELLVRSDQRLLYDVYRYNFPEESAGGEAFNAPDLDLENVLPLPTRELDLDRAVLAAVASQMERNWTAPEPSDVDSLIEIGEPVVPELPIEFDS